MKSLVTRPRGLIFIFIGAVLLFTIVFLGCSGTSDSPVATDSSDNLISSTGQDQVPVATMSLKNPKLASVMVIQNLHTKRLMAEPNVIGTATTINAAGQPAIMLLVTSQEAFDAAPKSLDGVPVEVILTDPIVAMGKPGGVGGGGGGGGVDHKAIQTAPIQLGTSGGWRTDLANGYCCGGTLGSLIQVGGNKRILSNYHVFEGDIVSGGNGIVATTGDYIIQPALIDVGCNANNAQNVATLVVTSSLPGNNVDCSSANIISGMVDASGAILEIGTLTAATVAAYIDQPVKKSGRTTGLGRAKVTGLNATVSVSYEDECAGSAAFTRTFTGQILTSNKRTKFLAGGDSGSLMVEDVDSNPSAVGLLFAGSRTLAVANPIDDVLSFLGGSMVGN